MQVSEKRRCEIKQLVYGLSYGMGAERLSRQMGCSFKEAEVYKAGLKDRFPGLVSFLLLRHESPSFVSCPSAA